MILFLNENGYIEAYNDVRSEDSVDITKNEVWYDKDFSFGMGEYIEGKIKLFKYVEGEIEIVYFDAPSELVESKPTQLDRIESMISKSQEQITKEARDAYTLELINSGII